ncbi:MAG: hypothetical protein ACR2HN_03355 [Tepidiformaceae bacterium]
MTTVTIELDDATFAAVRREAERTRAAGPDLLAEVVRTYALAAPEPVSDEIRAIMDQQLETYRPVFDRLAE